MYSRDKNKFSVCTEACAWLYMCVGKTMINALGNDLNLDVGVIQGNEHNFYVFNTMS